MRVVAVDGDHGVVHGLAAAKLLTNSLFYPASYPILWQVALKVKVLPLNRHRAHPSPPPRSHMARFRHAAYRCSDSASGSVQWTRFHTKEPEVLERVYAAIRKAPPQVGVLTERYGGDVAFSFDSNGRSVWVMALFGKGAPPAVRTVSDREAPWIPLDEEQEEDGNDEE